MSKEKWTPEEGERYFWVGSDAMAIEREFNRNDSCDYTRFQCGNYFRTIEEAQKAAEKFKELLLSLHEVKEEKKTVFPKLTAEVFNRPDCPEWAQYAAVDKCGYVRLFSHSPWLSESCWNWANGEVTQLFGVTFDASDWQKSRIKRPKKKTLPDWCKVGEWVWSDPKKIQGFWYEKIKNIYGLELIFESGIGVYFSQNIKPARLRPFNTKEMKALVGRTASPEYGTVFLVTKFFDNSEGGEVCVDDIYYNAGRLLDEFTIDNKPAGVLEHLENGEWVE